MKYPSRERVEEFAKDIFKGEYEGDDVEICVKRHNGGYVIEISRMYNYVPLNFAILYKVSEFFDTKNINDSRYHTNGCETCDYGSSYQITLTVNP